MILKTKILLTIIIENWARQKAHKKNWIQQEILIKNNRILKSLKMTLSIRTIQMIKNNSTKL